MIEANARFTGVNLTDAATIQASAMQAGLVDLDLMVVNDGLFESFFIVPLGLLVLDTNSQVPPETQVQNLISASQDFIASRPDTVIPPRSKEAVTALLSDMPTPTGTLRLDFTSSEPLGMARLMPLMIAGDPPQADTLFDALFTGATLNVTWDRAARASE